MRHVLAVLVLVLSGSISADARADDPVGRWRLDREAFEVQLASFMETQLGSFDNLPEATKLQVQAMMITIVSQATAGLGGVVEFNANGTVTFTDDAGNVDTGTWNQNGDIVTVTPTNARPGQQPIQGVLAGDAITVEQDMAEAPPDTPAMSMVFHRLP